MNEELTLSMAPYRPRLSCSFGVVTLAGRPLKRIGITAGAELPTESVLDAAMACAEPSLPQPATSGRRQGVGFLIVHRGTEALWAIVGWWELDLFYRRLFRAVLGTVDFEPVPPDGPTACVWELLAIDHERRAWIEHVLRRPDAPDAPDLAGYLAATFTV